jgi:hypothetical protein
VAWRCRRSTSLRLLAPFLFLLLALLVNAVLNANYALQVRLRGAECRGLRVVGGQQCCAALRWLCAGAPPQRARLHACAHP